MDVSKRIEFIINNLENTEVLADIGTDHGYVPLIALERGICNKAIACDINKDPLDKARLNAILEGIGDELEFRLGGGFEPLKHFANNPHKGRIVLGLISSKFPELEDKAAIKARIEEATQYVPLEQLCLSPQCGFASTEEGNIMTESQQWAKVRYVEEIAEEVWGED